MKKSNKKGFTIVELVIVIAVIAILAGVMIPTFGGIIADANKSAALQEARNEYTKYLMKHPEAEIDYVKNGDTYYDVDADFAVPTTAPTTGKILDLANWYIAGICADGDDDGSLCDKCGATVPAPAGE